eukprot:7878981-Pyramimonas_sp.AAC.1
MFFWALGTILEQSWNVLERLSEPAFCAILNRLGGDFGLSEALLLGAVLGHLGRSDRSPPLLSRS